MSPGLSIVLSLGEHTWCTNFHFHTQALAKDRPSALRNAEARLLRELGCEGSHGIVAGKPGYFGTSLLWRWSARGTSSRIDFGSDEPLPSWSWLAYPGEISHLNTRQGEVQWSPRFSFLRPSVSSHGNELVAHACDLDPTEIEEVVYDQPEYATRIDQNYVIVGGSTKITEAQVIYYFLLIGKATMDKYWMRLGVGMAVRKSFVSEQALMQVALI
ncbi:hypothetical protein S40288_02393 [Stachybotrys chartarum IBT 40288]|nr:hypothetical protein S40288_02393 [Stachybotrys chartarum IBT 40288]